MKTTDLHHDALVSNRSMPACPIIPALGYSDVPAAVAWLCRCFGFVERLRIGDHRSQLAFGDAAVVVTGGSAGDSSNTAAANHSIMLRVADADTHYLRALNGGARIVNPPTDYPYGERQYTAIDIGGHAWTFSQSVADTNPASWGGELIDET